MTKVIRYFRRWLNGNAFITIIFGLVCTLTGYFINFTIEHRIIKDALNQTHAQGFDPIKSRDLENQILEVRGLISENQDLQRMNELAWKDIRADLNSLNNNVKFIVDWIKPDIKRKVN